MKCSLVHDLFTEFDDGTLSGETRREFENHLTACPACVSALAEFQGMVQGLHLLELVPPPPGLLAGIHARLDRPGLLDRLAGIWNHTDFSIPLPAAVATIAVAMIAGFLFKSSPLMEQYLAGRQPSQQARYLSQEQRSQQPLPQAASRQRPELPGLPALPAHRGLQIVGYPPQASTPAAMTSAHAPSLLTLDLVVTPRTDEPGEQELLFRDLLTEGDWQIQRLQRGLLLIRLPPQQLPLLHEVLARHQAAVTPSAAASAPLMTKNRMLNVAVRLK